VSLIETSYVRARAWVACAWFMSLISVPSDDGMGSSPTVLRSHTPKNRVASSTVLRIDVLHHLPFSELTDLTAQSLLTIHVLKKE